MKRRQILKRELERAVENIGWSQHHIAQVMEAMVEHHPEITDHCIQINTALDQVKEVIGKLNEGL